MRFDPEGFGTKAELADVAGPVKPSAVAGTDAAPLPVGAALPVAAGSDAGGAAEVAGAADGALEALGTATLATGALVEDARCVAGVAGRAPPSAGRAASGETAFPSRAGVTTVGAVEAGMAA